MSVHQDEEQQLEALKRWWQEYRIPIIVGLVIGLGALFGSRAWYAYQERQAVSASAEYQQLRVELTQDNKAAVEKRGRYILENYSGSGYAALAALALAKVEVEQGDTSSARQHLQWAVDNADQPQLVHVARLRLAKVMADAGEQRQALALIEGVDQDGFTASYEELMGDLYAATGQTDKARTAYQRALAEVSAGGGSELLRMKLNDLGGNG